MARFTVPYGKESQTFDLPEAWDVHRVVPHPAEPADDPRRAVEEALEAPVGGFSWDAVKNAVKRRGAAASGAGGTATGDHAGGPTVAIAVNDKTRPVPHGELLPPLLARLELLGVARDHITLVIATGTHPPMRPDEFTAILPSDIVERYRIVSHDVGDEANLADIGTTSRGTPVRVNRLFVEADLRIVIGNIEPHQFMGYSGGVKSAVIGLAGRETINTNHAMMTLPGAMLGHFEDNPARQDVEEMGRMLKIDLALNAILNDHKKIVQVLAGEPAEVMRIGMPRVRELYVVEVDEPFDLVIASPGGHPKDINVYQAQKGLAHASLITRPQGEIVLAAACPEGSGSKGYEDWVSSRRGHEQVLQDFEAEGFRIGPHKAFQIAREATRFRTTWVTDMPAGEAERLLLDTAGSIEAALAAVRARNPQWAAGGSGRPRVGIMPVANATIAGVSDAGGEPAQ